MHEEALLREVADARSESAWEAAVARHAQAVLVARDERDCHRECLQDFYELQDAAEEMRQAVGDEEEAQAEARRAEAAAATTHAAAAAVAAEAAALAQLRAEREEDERALVRREEVWTRLRALQAGGPSVRSDPGMSSVPRVHSDPKVFDLTGMSASDMRAMASSVSQATTGPLWHDDAAWRPYDRAVKRMRYAQSPGSESDRVSEHGSDLW